MTSEAVGLALTIAKGVIKLGGRLDLLLTEAAAVHGPLVIPAPKFLPGPIYATMVKELKKYVADTSGMLPDPIGEFRSALLALLEQVDEATDDSLYSKLLAHYKRIYPAKAEPPAIDPNQEYLIELRRRLGTVDWNDPDVVQAAFYVAAGRDNQEIRYAARIGLLVVDVVSEFGAENAGLFVRDPKIGEVVEAVLTRFAKPDLENFDKWSPFLRHALGSTLNGMLDARGILQGMNPWLDGVLVALARAREKSSDGDEFLIGLLEGHGYRVLIGEGIRLAAEKIGGEHASKFESVASDFLLAAVPLVEEDEGGFGDFFRAHWADLLRAGLGAAAKHGPKLLAGQSPPVREALVAMIKAVAETDEDRSFFSADTVFAMAEAALGAVAANPDLLKPALKKPWLAVLVASVAGTISDKTIRQTFSNEGIEAIVRGALSTFAANPELIMPRKSGVAFDIVADILGAVAQAESFTLLPLASSAVSGTLAGLSRHPELVDSEFGPYVAQTAGLLGKLVADKSLTGVQAADVISAAAESMLANPAIFAHWKENVASRVVQVIVDVSGGDKTGVLAGASVVELVRRVFAVLARYGMSFVENKPAKELGDAIAVVLEAGLQRAAKELGRRLDYSDVPAVLADLVMKLVKGEIADLDPESENFKKLFSSLADALPLRV